MDLKLQVNTGNLLNNMNKGNITIGIDIGGTNTALGVVDYNNNSLFEESFLTRADEGVHAFLKRLTDKINQAYSKFEKTHLLEGIGVAAPSANYLTGIIESSANLKWGEVNFIEMMTRHFHVPIKLINDANAAALGEQLIGCAEGINNFIVITLGTGLGTGIVANGHLFYGENGFAGELGHTIIEKEGRQCNCGRNGCLEAYVSANGLKRTVLEFLGQYNDPSELRNMSIDNITGKLISELALKNDPIAIKAFNYTGEILGRALTNVVTCFDPKIIILSGGLVESNELLLVPTRKYFEKYLLSLYKGKVQIIKSELINGKAAILGSSSYIRSLINNGLVNSNN
jgi:glucokinase